MPSKAAKSFEISVFVNCPFDQDYLPLFHAAIFTFHDAGFQARCALELSNAVENRLAKIIRIIGECKYGIHDISRTELNPSKLPRFNMHLELGIFLGSQSFGDSHQRTKNCLIMDHKPYRYQRFISDLLGQDVSSNDGKVQGVIREIRNWLRVSSGRKNIPGDDVIRARYRTFRRALPSICQALRLTPQKLTFIDYVDVIGYWLRENTT
jgi:hypothetical protein